MDTKQKLYRVEQEYIGGKGVIGYIRTRDIVTKKKFYRPTIGSKPLSKMFRRKALAEMYAVMVVTRYQSLLQHKEFIESKENIQKELEEENEL